MPAESKALTRETFLVELNAWLGQEIGPAGLALEKVPDILMHDLVDVGHLREYCVRLAIVICNRLEEFPDKAAATITSGMLTGFQVGYVAALAMREYDGLLLTTTMKKAAEHA